MGTPLKLSSPTIQTVAIDKATTAALTLVDAVTGKKIRVTSILLITNGPVGVQFISKPSGAGSNIGGVLYFTANGGLPGHAGGSPLGIDTNTGEALQITLSAAIQVSGAISYYTE
jgi:hypothetical protein